MSGYDYTGKVMLVTGGAGGIGSALCRRFAIGGAVCVVVDIDGDRAHQVADSLPGTRSPGARLRPAGPGRGGGPLRARRLRLRPSRRAGQQRRHDQHRAVRRARGGDHRAGDRPEHDLPVGGHASRHSPAEGLRRPPCHHHGVPRRHLPAGRDPHLRGVEVRVARCQEAIRTANITPYGLAASLWTHDLDTAFRLARGIQAGVVSVNAYSEGDITAPFGGWKQSGFGGAERSTDAFAQWTREKTVWIRTR